LAIVKAATSKKPSPPGPIIGISPKPPTEPATLEHHHTCYELNGREFNAFFARNIRKGWDLADGLWSIEGSITSLEDEEPQQEPSVGRIRELGVAIVARHAVQSRIDECVAHHVM
jgi:hypothetical protein